MTPTDGLSNVYFACLSRVLCYEFPPFPVLYAHQRGGGLEPGTVRRPASGLGRHRLWTTALPTDAFKRAVALRVGYAQGWLKARDGRYLGRRVVGTLLVAGIGPRTVSMRFLWQALADTHNNHHTRTHKHHATITEPSLHHNSTT